MHWQRQCTIQNIICTVSLRKRHAYLQRRRLTEAAKLLVFSNTSILEIALISGYESQQAFTERFKAMMFFGMYTIVDLFFVARFVDLNALSSIDKQRRAAF